MKDEEAIQAARTAKRLKEDRKAKNITQDEVSLGAMDEKTRQIMLVQMRAVARF